MDATAAFARERISPQARHLDEDGWLDPVWRDLCALGVPGICAPTEVGGLALPYSAYLAVTATLASASAVAALMPALNVLVARALVAQADADVQQHFLPGLVAGTARACWCFTEPQTGSDPRSITTTATAHPDGGWSLRGTKSFISHSSVADTAVVFALLDGRLSAFIDMVDAGFQPSRREPLIAFRGADTGTVVLDGMRARSMIGGPGDGYTLLVAMEAEAKLRASAICLGMAEHALRESVRYAMQRQHRGEPIGQKFQSVQWLLAECAAKVEAMRAMVDRAGMAVDEGRDITGTAARVKLMSSRLCREVATDAVQVHGAYGVSRDFDVEMLYRQAKVYEVVQGVSELNRVIIARDLLSGRS